MDESTMSRNWQNDSLGLNKIGKNIRKTLHQPNFNSADRQQPQPQVYNISKNDFRDFVQQLTGSPLHQELHPRPPQKPQSMRLQRIRPPPLTPINRPQIPIHPSVLVPAPPPPDSVVPCSTTFVRHPSQFGQPCPTMLRPPSTPGGSIWPVTAESPVSAYVRYLQNSMMDSGPRQPSPLPQAQPQVPGQPLTSGLIPNSLTPAYSSVQMNGHPPLPYPWMNGPPPLPSQQVNGPPISPSPASQFLLPSPTCFLNLLSPCSSYPLLSPGLEFPPLTPIFSFSPMAHSGTLGSGPQPPPSPGYGFPVPPLGFYTVSSPRWRENKH